MNDQASAGRVTCGVVRTFTPAWLRKAGLVDEAVALESCDAITSTELCEAALPAAGYQVGEPVEQENPDPYEPRPEPTPEFTYPVEEDPDE